MLLGRLKFIDYGLYIYAPLAATVVWVGTLLGLLLRWAIDDRGRDYEGDLPTILFVSHIGAAHKLQFILGAAFTLLFFALTLLFERWLRHVDRIPGTVRRREYIYDTLAIIFGVAGGIALLILSIFDSRNHSRVHWSFTLVFIVCIALCAIFQTCEIIYLKQDHPDKRHLARNAVIKITVVGAAVIGAICFGGTYAACGGDADTPRCDRISSVAAVFEWLIAFLFGGFLATFILDLWPAAKTSPRHLRRLERSHEKEKEKGLMQPDSPSMSHFESVRPSVDNQGHIDQATLPAGARLPAAV